MDKIFKVFVIFAIVILFIGTSVATIVAVDATNKYKEYSKNENTETSSNKKQDKEDDKKNKSDENTVIVQLGDAITSNLGSGSNVMRLSVAIGLDSSSKEYKTVSAAVTSDEVRIRDEIIRIMRSQSYDSMTKPDAQDVLAEIILNRVSELMDTDIIQEVIFGEFFVQ